MNDKDDIKREFGRSVYEPPPSETKGIITTIQVGGVEILIRTREYEDGRLFDLSVDNNHRDLNLRPQLGTLAKMISTGLQHGTPLKAFVDTFAFSKAPRTLKVEGYDGIESAHSIMDAVMHVLAREYKVPYGPQLALPAPEKKPAWKPTIIQGGKEGLEPY